MGLRPRGIDAKFWLSFATFIVALTICVGFVRSQNNTDELVHIADRAVSQGERKDATITELRMSVASLSKALHDRALRDQQETRAQRHQINVLIRILRVNGLPVPISLLTPRTSSSSPQRSTTTRPPLLAQPDLPGNSDAHRSPRTLDRLLGIKRGHRR